MKNKWLLLPVIGTAFFLLLYIVAAWLYPGGSQAYRYAEGFSWAHNYWCNLLNEVAINGRVNPARPVAMAGMAVLAITLSSFWILFPVKAKAGRAITWVISTTGTLSIASTLFLSTSWHNTVTNIAGGLGVVALTGTLITLYKLRWVNLFWWGIVNLLLVGLNNYLYYHEAYIKALPVVQKITFLLFLLWFCVISLRLYKSKPADTHK
ncbi:hypothetical protein [Foetidibacter luteolus]|uniref:hypothetical protein n=1 Tax=Foetidibacter luteolus TaxID=2608880 RepID=UPI00129AF8EE|nr:hypothetical protein [Foetidibacter luteolus]